MKPVIKVLLFMLTVVVFIQCEKEYPNENWIPGGYWIDSRDGHSYATIPIGDQVWLAENMAYLPSVSNEENGSEDEGNESLAFYYVLGYDGTSVSAAKADSNYKKYGVLYNWNAALEACPNGWHLPSDDEWTELETYLGGSDTAGVKLKATWGWSHCRWLDNPGNGTNESGFTALPGGQRIKDYQDPMLITYEFSGSWYLGGWWSSSEMITRSEGTYVYCRLLMNSHDDILMYGYLEHEAFSVRCIKD